ncbi:MAG: AAA family ATPase [Phycisphaerae bacterium]|jgi:hypothetical protein
MLVEFSVENYRSFRDRVTLSLVASADKSMPGNVIEKAQGTNLRLLRSVGVFGPNASGKSNLLRAMAFMRDFVLESGTGKRPGSRIGVTPFKFDQHTRSRPSRFEVMFVHEGVPHEYGFAVDSGRVHEESLRSFPRGQPRLLFKRTASGRGASPDVRFGTHWQGAGRSLVHLIRDDALFISVAAQFAHPVAMTVHDWFDERFREVSWFPVAGGEMQFTVANAKRSKEMLRSCLQFLREADIGIDELEIIEMPIRESPSWRDIPGPLREELFRELPEDASAARVRTLHRAGAAGRGSVTLDLFEDESDGTQKLFALAGPWLYVLEHGCVLFIDELEARLHPLLTTWLVRMFHDERTNPKGAQLVFATHDASLLQSDLLRRDQVWFTEKDRDGASTLYSLWDYKKLPRKSENLMRGYLAGRYGAIPLVEGPAE